MVWALTKYIFCLEILVHKYFDYFLPLLLYVKKIFNFSVWFFMFPIVDDQFSFYENKLPGKGKKRFLIKWI